MNKTTGVGLAHKDVDNNNRREEKESIGKEQILEHKESTSSSLVPSKKENIISDEWIIQSQDLEFTKVLGRGSSSKGCSI